MVGVAGEDHRAIKPDLAEREVKIRDDVQGASGFTNGHHIDGVVVF